MVGSVSERAFTGMQVCRLSGRDGTLYRELCGAPVYDSREQWIGAFGSAVGVCDETAKEWALVPAKEILAMWKDAKKLQKTSGALGTLKGPSEVRPGVMVFFARMWGDWIDGELGRVSLVEGSDFVGMGVALPGTQGMRYLGVIDAQVTGRYRSGGEIRALVRLKNLVGTATWNSRVGVCGVIGRAPPSYALSIVVREKDGKELGRAFMNTVREVGYLGSQLDTCVGDLLARVGRRFENVVQVVVERVEERSGRVSDTPILWEGGEVESARAGGGIGVRIEDVVRRSSVSPVSVVNVGLTIVVEEENVVDESTLSTWE